MLSFHGIHQCYVRLTDDYLKRYEDTYRALSTALAFHNNKIMMTYQSRFIWELWLTPYTDKALKMLTSSEHQTYSRTLPWVFL
ncbi:ferrochelatase [Candidatus Williamhamiltonella defendens]|uniref:ferrochelatase n=1 Tax=Candidatus Williamhamiltonella defendens TaxID=138072 RepID=UPI0022A6E5D7|nr:ferrochelatase [Candidatus Hamiltonella defensa]